MSTTRKSERKNKGVPPSRYTDAETDNLITDDTKSKSKSSMTSRTRFDVEALESRKSLAGSNKVDGSSKISSSRKREGEKSGRHGSKAPTNNSKATSKSSIMKRQLEIELEAERRLVELEKKLIIKEMELKKAALEEEFSERESEIEDVAIENRDEIQHWINDIEIPTNNQSVLSSRFGKGIYSDIDLGSETGIRPKAEEGLKKEKPENQLSQFLARQSVSKELPSFSGDPTEWLQFITAFKESTEMCGFSNRENIARLQRCLKGKAKETVQALLYFTFEVDKIIDTLEKRYGKSDLIICDLISSVKKFPSLREDKLDSIIDFSYAVQNLAVTVTSLKNQQYLSNPQLLNEIVFKLTPNLKLEWGKQLCFWNKANKITTILDFSSWFNEITEALNCVVVPDYEFEKRKKFVCTTTEDKATGCCLYCKMTNHKLDKCHFFKKLEVEKRWEWVRSKKICFCCLGVSHQVKYCRKRKKCSINNCIKSHHQLLHTEESNQASSSDSCEVAAVSHHSREDEGRVLLRVAPVILYGPNKEIHTHALFDEASTITLIDEELAAKLGSSGPIDPLRLRWTNSMTSEENESRKINLRIRGENETETYAMKNVRTVSNLNLPTQTVDSKNMAKKWKHLASKNVISMTNAKPQILIGQDHIDLIIAREVIEGAKNTPVLSLTKLGWIIHGSVSSFRGRVDDDFILHTTNEYEELHQLVQQSFKLEALGVKIMEEMIPEEDERALKIMDETSKRTENNHWEIGLLWKQPEIQFENSKPLAVRRLKSVERKMDRNPIFRQEYGKKLDEYVSKGYATKISQEESNQNEKIWYLPHFGVINEKKPGKIRFVFDAAAKVNGVSLNDKLLKGPDLLNSLLGVLFKFRQRKIAFTADIQEMFHQVFIREEDRDAQRFLWWGEGGILDEYRMNVMIFGAASSPASAQYIMRKNAEQYKTRYPGAVRVIQEQHYVDDYLDSVDSEDDASRLISEVIQIHKNGGFNIRNWTSNSREVLKQLPEGMRARELKNLDLEQDLPTERVLGLFWNPNEDSFSFRMEMTEISQILNGTTRSTKRDVLKIVMTIFDPLGFLSNFSIKARILLQEVWRMKTGWDDELEATVNEKWINWLGELRKIPFLKVPRWYGSSKDSQNVELHVFCDTSSKAFAAVCYLRILSDISVHTSFIMAKSRVAPLKVVSIPRLELQAAVLGVRLAKTIKQNHSIQIDETFYWSDSRTALSWIKSDARDLKPFVSHRVSEILENSDIVNWNWIPSNENIADEATRENIPCDWNQSSRWINGPSFLKLNKKYRFEEELEEEHERQCDEEIKKEMKKEYVAVVIEVKNVSECLPDIRKFSSYLRLLRTTAWTLRFVNRLKHTTINSSELLPGEIEDAEKLWIKHVQQQSFQEEIYSLKHNIPVSKTSKLYKLSPNLDSEGILRIDGRLNAAEMLDERTKFPIILEPKHLFTRLLLHFHHIKVGHHGRELVLNEIRQKFWILRARAAIRSTWNSCQWCKNMRAKPIIPEMSPLPKCRVSSFVRPFTFTGLDYFGPLSVTVGRRREKRYGALFTCLSTRAVHLELAASLNTDSAILAIRRMIARRGYPQKIYSDNGTNLRGAAKELKNAMMEMDQNRITTEMATKGIEWIFLPPLTPHMGGSWERLVRSVKTALQVTLKEQAPKEEVLLTLLAEAENIVNSRPLVHVSLDPADEEAITPNHFLIGTSSAAPVPCLLTENDLVTRKHWRRAQYFTEKFWKRWVKEYLPTLVARTKWYDKQGRGIQVGDVVVIVDGDLPRNCWLKGVVLSTHPGTDGQVRSVDVKTKLGTYRRPVVKICRLEVEKTTED